MKHKFSLFTDAYLDAFIAFFIFATVLSIFLIYYLFDYELDAIIDNFIKSLKIYLSDENLKIIINSSYFINEYKKTREDADIINKNDKNDNDFFKLIQTIFIVGFILVAFIIGIIIYIYNYGLTFQYLNFTELGIIFIINVAIIVSAEVLLFLFVLRNYQFIEIRRLLQLFIGLPV
jgi:hypothetical protein